MSCDDCLFRICGLSMYDFLHSFFSSKGTGEVISQWGYNDGIDEVYKGSLPNWYSYDALMPLNDQFYHVRASASFIFLLSQPFSFLFFSFFALCVIFVV